MELNLNWELEFGPRCMCTRVWPSQRNLNIAAPGAMLGRSFSPVVRMWASWVSRIQHGWFRGTAVKTASCYGEYNLRTKRRNLHPRMQKLKILFAFIIFHLFVFSNVHPEERCWFIEAAAARHSHWGTSEELYSRGKESTLSMLQAQRTRKPTSDLSFPHPQLWRNKEGRQTAGGREQEMFKPGI